MGTSPSSISLSLVYCNSRACFSFQAPGPPEKENSQPGGWEYRGGRPSLRLALRISPLKRGSLVSQKRVRSKDLVVGGLFLGWWSIPLGIISLCLSTVCKWHAHPAGQALFPPWVGSKPPISPLAPALPPPEAARSGLPPYMHGCTHGRAEPTPLCRHDTRRPLGLSAAARGGP